MNSDVTKRKLWELEALGIRYANFLDRFRDTALEVKGDRVILKLAPKNDARGHDRLYPTSPPGFEFTEVF